MSKKERKIINDIILEAGNDERLFRANCGLFWTGKMINYEASKIKAAREILSGFGHDYLIFKYPRAIKGLPEGFHDIFGFKSITATDDMIGKKIAVFKTVEVKTKNVHITDEQERFRNMVNKFGGISEVYIDNES